MSPDSQYEMLAHGDLAVCQERSHAQRSWWLCHELAHILCPDAC